MATLLSYSKHSIFSPNNIKKFILPYYGLENSNVKMIKFKDTDKQRAVYKVENKDKFYCLKKVYYSKEALLYVYSCLEWLYRYGLNVPKLIPTIYKGRFVDFHGMLFILTEWIEGTKCNFDNLNHIFSSSLELGKLHTSTRNFSPILGSENKKAFDNLYISIEKHFHDILKSSNYAFQCKDHFSREFLSTLEENLELCKICTSISSEINPKFLSTSLCHGDYVNKNILFSDDNKVWIIDFDKCKMDYSAHDISYFLRRLLKRDNTNWNLDITLEVLNNYIYSSTLSSDDLKYIVSYICFPQKYWKISKDYYKNRKKCNKKAFNELLKKNNKKVYAQLEFSKSILNYFTLTNWKLP